MKILKEVRKAMDRNAEYCKKELETIKRNQEKIENINNAIRCLFNKDLLLKYPLFYELNSSW